MEVETKQNKNENIYATVCVTLFHSLLHTHTHTHTQEGRKQLS